MKGTGWFSFVLLLTLGALATACAAAPPAALSATRARVVAPASTQTAAPTAPSSLAATATPTVAPSPTPTMAPGSTANPYGQIGKIDSPDKRWTAVLDATVGSLDLLRADGQRFPIFPPGSTAEQVSWSPDSRRLLVVLTHYILPAPGSGDPVTANRPAEISQVTIQADRPDGPKLLYQALPAYRRVGGDLPAHIELSQWSPNSRYFLFWLGGVSASLSADGEPLYSYDTETLKETLVAETALLNPRYQSWAPDSSQLAVTAGGDRSAQTTKWLDLVEMKTGQVTTAVSTTEQIPGIVAWSPKGDLIAYAAIRAAEQDNSASMSFDNPAIVARRVYLLDWKTGRYRRLNNVNAFQDAPVWSKDGKTLYYVQREGDDMVLMAADPATGRAQPVPGARQPAPSGVGYYGQSQWDDLLEYRPDALHAPVPALAQTYLDATDEFSLRYPADWTVGRGWDTLPYRCADCTTIGPTDRVPDRSDLGPYSGRVFVSIEIARAASPKLDALLSEELNTPGPGQSVYGGNRLSAFEQRGTTAAGKPALYVETMDEAGIVNHMLIVLDGDRVLMLRGRGDARVFDAIAATLKLALPSTPAPSAALPPASAWPIYRHPLGIEVRYPPGWRVDSTGVFVDFCDGPEAKQCFGITYDSKLKQASDFLDAVGSQAATTKMLTLDGQPAVFVQIRDPASFEGYRSVVAVVTPDGRGLTIGNRTGTQIFEQVLGSIHFFRSDWP